MLVDHSDPELHCLRRRIDPHLLPADVDVAGCRLVQTEEYIHESTLSGSVFTKECVHFTRAYIKVDIAVRVH